MTHRPVAKLPACPSRRKAAADRNFDNNDNSLKSSARPPWATTQPTPALPTIGMKGLDNGG